MWTNQGKQLLANYIFNKNEATTTSFKTMNNKETLSSDFVSNSSFLNTSNEVTASFYNNYKDPEVPTTAMVTQASGRPVLYVGMHDTEPTADDFTLGMPIPMDMVGAANVYGGGTVTTISIPLKNTSGGPVTIREICLAILCSDNSGAAVSNSKGTAIMLNRKLLPEPVEMGVNDVYVFTFELDWANLTD